MAPFGHQHSSWRPSTGVITVDGQVQWPPDPLTGLAESMRDAARRGRRWPPLQIAARRGSSAPAPPRRRGRGGSGCKRSQEAWRPAGFHTNPTGHGESSEELEASFCSSQLQQSTVVEPEPSLPWYNAWPSSGPSQDDLLLRTRMAKAQGHVDWVRWSKDASIAPSGTVATHYPVPLRADWCPNYGVVGEDGSIIWPSEEAPWYFERPQAAAESDDGAGSACSEVLRSMDGWSADDNRHQDVWQLGCAPPSGDARYPRAGQATGAALAPAPQLVAPPPWRSDGLHAAAVSSAALHGGPPPVLDVRPQAPLTQPLSVAGTSAGFGSFCGGPLDGSGEGALSLVTLELDRLCMAASILRREDARNYNCLEPAAFARTQHANN